MLSMSLVPFAGSRPVVAFVAPWCAEVAFGLVAVHSQANPGRAAIRRGLIRARRNPLVFPAACLQLMSNSRQASGQRQADGRGKLHARPTAYDILFEPMKIGPG